MSTVDKPKGIFELLEQVQSIECPYARAIEIIGNRSTLLILKELHLGQGVYRFSELLEILKPMSSRTLSSKLTSLEGYGIVRRTVISEKPVKVEYRLTDRGLDLRHMMDELAHWSEKWFSGSK